ncbi:hypothetical protein CWE04_11670 [Thomasclavelia cocleata]|uniref:Uncharacterized protein n=1 Tax=Thomasclavelia cocleata TaxID=69824 RepID=A0A1I0BI07_9FIRM|nr:hypothetical protein [Thomasclavelia cocleata]MCR1960238.1 hypothetical protein [Thomasclavelia cocleata]NDO41788.1 hypothetical protein [Thomasclavelia cocleata]PJN79860.1 hypothetical protein CWE04_11670 [Thomasclavelia cocleata]SET06437.1 hypothetical protein SAMN04489758_101127 [Thomasclavelia cocleata]
MNKRLKFLLEKEILTESEIEEVEEHEEVLEFNILGSSGKNIGFTWFDVKTSDSQTFDVYCKY